MGLIDKISESIKTAMKQKNVQVLESLRAIKSALLLAKTQKGASSEIAKEDEIKLVKQRKESADIYISQNRNELAEVEINQSKIIEGFLPEQISSEEIEIIITDIIQEIGAEGMKDMGKVMGMASVKLSGKADGKTISNIVRAKLT
jgi:uncharacterized protein YqeY